MAIFHIDDYANNNLGYPGQSGWPGNGNHYIVALLQADGSYDLERGLNRGDSYDLFHGGGTNAISPLGISGGAAYPNTKAYQGGTSLNTGISIINISPAGATMTFDITFGDVSHEPSTSPSTSPPTSSQSPTVVFHSQLSIIESAINTPGFCLGLLNADTTNGGVIYLESCDLESSQWHIDSRGYIRSKVDTNKCIDVSSAGYVDGSPIIIQDCVVGLSSQKWEFTNSGTIQSVGNLAYCLDENGENGAVYLWACDGTTDQYYTVTSLEKTASPIPSASPSTTPNLIVGSDPSSEPSHVQSSNPSLAKRIMPSAAPSKYLSLLPSSIPSIIPTITSSKTPSVQPSSVASMDPSSVPSAKPNTEPSSLPSTVISTIPSAIPSTESSSEPTTVSSEIPSVRPSNKPSPSPSTAQSNVPSAKSSDTHLSVLPSLTPTYTPSSQASMTPSIKTLEIIVPTKKIIISRGSASTTNVSLIGSSTVPDSITFTPSNRKQLVANFVFETLPKSLDLSNITSIRFKAHILAPPKSESRVVLHIRNFKRRKWILLGKNKRKTPFDYNLWTKEIKGFTSVSDYFNTKGSMLVRMKSMKGYGEIMVNALTITLA